MAATWEAGPLALEAGHAGNLTKAFIVAPYSTLSTRSGEWQERRRAWLSLGLKSEVGRDADLLSLSPAEGARDRWAMQSGEGRELQPGQGNARSDYGAYETNVEEGAQGGTSIFDPVLCELVYRWWAPAGGLVLDPFAGGSVRGIVAAVLGHPYTGVDLSSRQLEANRVQAEAILEPGAPRPVWLHGDSRHLDQLLPAGQMYDLILTCPPYFDLEVYSDDPGDLSNAADYGAFLEGYAQVIASAAARLQSSRFAVLVVSEIRDKAGMYRGLVPDTIRAAQAAGLHLYNDAVLINAAGSGALRATKYMESSRKLVRLHQNVLCFIKGVPPRGWSYERAAPPSPQLSMALEAPAEPSTLGPILRPLLPDVDYGPPPEEGTLEWVADVEGIPDDVISEDAPLAEAVPSAAPLAAPALDASVVAQVGRPAAPVAPGPFTGEKALEEPAPARITYRPAPEDRRMPLETWLEEELGRIVCQETGEVREWDRSAWAGQCCYTCGREPDGEFMDGSPTYLCMHPPIVLMEPLGAQPPTPAPPRGSLEEGMEMAARYQPALVEVLVQHLAAHLIRFRPATRQEDLKQATDYVAESDRGDIGLRVRSPGASGRWHNLRDCTIRTRTQTGRGKTEMAKVQEGWCRWYLWAWARDGQQLADWVIVDMDVFREQALWEHPDADEPGRNADGSEFRGYAIAMLAKAGAIVAASRPDPRAIAAGWREQEP